MSAIEQMYDMLSLENKVTIINAINLLLKKESNPGNVTVEQWDFIYKMGDLDERAKIIEKMKGEH